MENELVVCPVCKVPRLVNFELFFDSQIEGEDENPYELPCFACVKAEQKEEEV